MKWVRGKIRALCWMRLCKGALKRETFPLLCGFDMLRSRWGILTSLSDG